MGEEHYRASVAESLSTDGYTDVFVLDAITLANLSDEAATLLKKLIDGKEYGTDDLEAMGYESYFKELDKRNLIEQEEGVISIKHDHIVAATAVTEE